MEVLLQIYVQAFEDGVESLFSSVVGELTEAVLELGDAGVCVLCLLFDGVEPSSVFDVGAPECVFS